VSKLTIENEEIRTIHACRCAKSEVTGTASMHAAGSVGATETQYLDLPRPLPLDCGRELHPVRVAYETYGTLAPERDNVILVCHALSGDAHAAGFSKEAAEQAHAMDSEPTIGTARRARGLAGGTG